MPITKLKSQKSIYLYVNLDIHLVLVSLSANTLRNMLLMLRVGRGALGRMISPSCFFK